jgi:phage tail-like protein
MDLGGLRLRRNLPLFRRAGRTIPLTPEQRRGAGRDAYGNWYWIAEDPTVIEWRAAGGTDAGAWWTVADLAATCATSTTADNGDFASCAVPPPPELELCGLAVTTGRYLAAGYVSASAASGILLFDLATGGAPRRLEWPAASGFAPFDIADTPDGGLLVLDRAAAVYWRLDRHFRVRGENPTTPTTFQPADGGPPETMPGPSWPIGVPVAPGSPSGSVDAVAIEPGPDGTVLVLDSAAGRGYSVLYCFDDGALRWSTSLADAVEVISPTDPTDTPQRYSVLAQDFCYLAGPPAIGPLTPPMAYLADAEGTQVVAFSVDPGTGDVVAQPDFLPLRRWDGKALVRAATGAWYDFADRWVPLEVYGECRFEPAGTLTTPTDFAGGVSGQPFDSQLPGCVWHRLFLDAQIPTGTSLSVQARAADDPDLLLQAPWLEQPVPYLRSDGCELPWYDPWVDLETAGGELPDLTGTWELLFQQVVGRYLQVQVSLEAGERSSPLIRSLRAWYSRFSYVDHYLPALYGEDAAPYGFLDRFLANFEGFYTTLEERIEHTHAILDARTVPAADLPWLAAWFGMALDPQWSPAQSRFLIRFVDTFYRWRGTIPGLVATLRLYLGPGVDQSVFDPVCPGVGTVRVVEKFLTRDTGGALYGDPSAPLVGATEADRVTATAHRFDVLVPASLSADQLAMVTKIIDTNKPAHTSYNVHPYDNFFVVGKVRLGIDTQLGTGVDFGPIVVGGALGRTYLGFPYPFDVPDRLVIDRDRVGELSIS